MPDAVLIGGANDAGKTTFACSLVPLLHPDAPFLNADEVAREGYAPLAPVSARGGKPERPAKFYGG